MVLIPRELLDFINNGKNFLIAGHESPDGDCIGSQLVLASALKRLGKEVSVYSAGPFNRTEIESYRHLFIETLPEPSARQNPAPSLIIVDCSSLDRVGGQWERLKGLPAAVIDHHSSREDSAEAEICCIDENAPSATFLVMKLLLELGLEINREEAGLLFFGLCTDTGFFRHVEENGAGVFEAAAALIRLGASPKSAFLAMNGGKSLNSRILIGNALTSSESHFGGKLILVFQKYEDISRLGLENKDSDSLYQLLQSVAGVEAIVLIRQETPAAECNVGLRSRSLVDVGKVAKTFGGGGHKNASGFTLAGSIAETRQKIIEAFESVFD